MTPEELREVADELNQPDQWGPFAGVDQGKHPTARKLRAHADVVEQLINRLESPALPFMRPILLEGIFRQWAKQLRGEHE